MSLTLLLRLKEPEQLATILKPRDRRTSCDERKLARDSMHECESQLLFFMRRDDDWCCIGSEVKRKGRYSVMTSNSV
jgi:hypothetical protein